MESIIGVILWMSSNARKRICSPKPPPRDQLLVGWDVLRKPPGQTLEAFEKAYPWLFSQSCSSPSPCLCSCCSLHQKCPVWLLCPANSYSSLKSKHEVHLFYEAFPASLCSLISRKSGTVSYSRNRTIPHTGNI